MIKFNAKTVVIASDALTAGVLDILEADQTKRVGAIIDQNVVNLPDVETLTNALKKRGDLVLQTLKVSEPTTDLVDQVSDLFTGESLDMLIGIGGGSTLDLTKAVSVISVNPGQTSDYHGTNKPIEKSIKKITIPTTAGTGSEVTPGAVLVNEKTKFKRALGGDLVAADYALLCAKLTLSMPPSVMATTGMDAIAHAVESYTARNANTITQMYSKEAFRLVFNNLTKAFENPNDLEVRKEILIGSCLAGFAIFNSNILIEVSISSASLKGEVT